MEAVGREPRSKCTTTSKPGKAEELEEANSPVRVQVLLRQYMEM